jgi:hypothetical protein
MKPILALSVLGLLLAQASSDIRIDTFDPQSNRTGYLIVNPDTGRIDRFDARSNRTGYGTVSPSGRIDIFDTRGHRTGSGTLTSPPTSAPRNTR